MCLSRSFINLYLILSEEELWQHRREVKHERPDKIPRKYDKANHTPEELKAMGLLKCQACDNFYPNRRMLRCHMYTCHRELMPKYNCPICAVEFKTRKYEITVEYMS